MWAKKKQWIRRCPMLHEQSHPLKYPPLGPLRVKYVQGSTLVSTTLVVQMTGEGIRRTQSYPVNYTYVHTQTHRLCCASLLCQPFLLPLWAYFCWPVYGGVDRGEHAISQRPKYRELNHPWNDLIPEQRLAYLHLLPSQGPFREMTPVWSSGLWILRLGCRTTWQPIQGTVKACDWHVPTLLH